VLLLQRLHFLAGPLVGRQLLLSRQLLLPSRQLLLFTSQLLFLLNRLLLLFTWKLESSRGQLLLGHIQLLLVVFHLLDREGG
jgi:hypothetical protein